MLVAHFGSLDIKPYKEIEPWLWACVQLKLGNPQITWNNFQGLWQIYNKVKAINLTLKGRKQSVPSL